MRKTQSPTAMPHRLQASGVVAALKSALLLVALVWAVDVGWATVEHDEGLVVERYTVSGGWLQPHLGPERWVRVVVRGDVREVEVDRGTWREARPGAELVVATRRGRLTGIEW